MFIAKPLAFRQQIDFQKSIKIGKIFQGNHLKPLTERYYCHPAMKGRWSLKAVLPTIAPELDYGALAIGDGGAASNAWRELYHSDTSAERRAELRAALADYCRRDTLALVRLAAFLAETQPE